MLRHLNLTLDRWFGALTVLLLCEGVRCIVSLEAAQDQFAYIGAFSNMRSTGEHVYGYELQLWRDDSGLKGLWSQANGQDADFPATMISDVTFDESSGQLQFTGEWCDASDVFTGSVTGDRIAGHISITQKTGRTEKKELVLSRQTDDIGPISETQWDGIIKRILSARGPKC